MWCRRASGQLSAYVDGELDQAAARAVEAHVAGCSRCAGDLQGLRRMSGILRRLPDEELPAGLHSRIMVGLAYAHTAPASVPAPVAHRGMLRNPWMCTALTGALAALALGVLVTRGEGARREEGARHDEAGSLAVLPAPRQPSRERAEPPARETGEAPGVTAPRARRHVSLRPAGPRVRVAQKEAAAPAERRTRRACAPRVARRERPASAETPTGVESSVEIRLESASGRSAGILAGPQPAAVVMPGEPVVNTTTVGPSLETLTPVAVTAPEKEGPRMAGAAADNDMPRDEDEGLRELRMFFEERNRTVPQPPLLNGERRMRKL